MDFALQTAGSYDEVLAAAHWAAARDMVAIAVPDHYVSGLTGEPTTTYDPYPVLAGLARDIDVLELVVLVSPITFRHPAVMLKAATTIDHMSGGRFALGLGTGWLDREHEIFGIPYPPMAERYEILEEALGYVRAGRGPEPAGFHGRHFALERVAVLPRPIGPMRIVVGGVGPVKTPTLAGRYADEFNIYPGDRDDVRRRIDVAKSAAAVAGRDFDQILLSTSGQIVAAATEAEYRDKLDRLAESAKLDVEDLEAHFQRRNTPRGSYEQVAEQVSMLAGLGAERFYVQWPAGFDREEGSEILGYLRNAVG
jgi:alkanesulfonate monooxygenase SsuD/methylene tetrahydromethanopterin reductase-like flavin-dependent oxidoreductase (luciferase family)